MKVNVTFKDYTTMTVKELEKEHALECQKLLDLINSGASQEAIQYQKKQMDLVYQQLNFKLRKISQMKG